MNATDISAARSAAISGAIDRIRGIERTEGITRASLEKIKAELLALAAQSHLFPTSEFPPPPPGEKAGRRYLLQEDADHRFALYLNALNPGNETKPHDHTTWASIVAVEGQELNRLYDRVDDGRTEGKATLKLRAEVMVEPGNGIAFMADDIHSIHTTGTVPTRHLHMYGLALEKLENRVGYDIEAGTVVPYNRNFMAPTAGKAAATA